MVKVAPGGEGRGEGGGSPVTDNDSPKSTFHPSHQDPSVAVPTDEVIVTQHDLSAAVTPSLPLPACAASPDPVSVLCPNCRERVTSIVTRKGQGQGHDVDGGALQILIIASCCCCLIPLLAKPQVTVHTCPSCLIQLGRHTAPTSSSHTPPSPQPRRQRRH